MSQLDKFPSGSRCKHRKYVDMKTHIHFMSRLRMMSLISYSTWYHLKSSCSSHWLKHFSSWDLKDRTYETIKSSLPKSFRAICFIWTLCYDTNNRLIWKKKKNINQSPYCFKSWLKKSTQCRLCSIFRTLNSFTKTFNLLQWRIRVIVNFGKYKMRIPLSWLSGKDQTQQAVG